MMPDRPQDVTISMSQVTGLRLAKDPLIQTELDARPYLMCCQLYVTYLSFHGRGIDTAPCSLKSGLRIASQ